MENSSPKWKLVLLSVSFFAGIDFSSSQTTLLLARTPFSSQNSRLGDPASLVCQTTSGEPLSICLWETIIPTSANGTSAQNPNLVINFNPSNARVGSPSHLKGYSYSGSGLSTGNCGLKIDAVGKDDFQPWQCTLFGDNVVYRNVITLNEGSGGTFSKGEEVPKEAKKTSPEAFLSESEQERAVRQFSNNNNTQSNRGRASRPIVTVDTVSDADFSGSASITPDSPVGAQIQEIQIQSAGLQIKPRKERKLVLV